MIINNYKKNEKFIKWIVNYNCNYSCSYCFEKDFHGKDIIVNDIIETAYKVKKFIYKFLKIIKKLAWKRLAKRPMRV